MLFPHSLRACHFSSTNRSGRKSCSDNSGSRPMMKSDMTRPNIGASLKPWAEQQHKWKSPGTFTD